MSGEKSVSTFVVFFQIKEIQDFLNIIYKGSPETVDKHKWSVVGGQDGIEGELLGPGCPPVERQGKNPRSQLRSSRQRPLQSLAVPFINFTPLKVNVCKSVTLNITSTYRSNWLKILRQDESQ